MAIRVTCPIASNSLLNDVSLFILFVFVQSSLINMSKAICVVFFLGAVIYISKPEKVVIYIPKSKCKKENIKINTAGPCLTTAIWRCRKNSSQWQRSFQWKLHSHWLKFLRQRHVAVVRQGPGPLWGNLAATGGFLSQSSYTESVSISWRHHVCIMPDGGLVSPATWACYSKVLLNFEKKSVFLEHKITS